MGTTLFGGSSPRHLQAPSLRGFWLAGKSLFVSVSMLFYTFIFQSTKSMWCSLATAEVKTKWVRVPPELLRPPADVLETGM